MIIFKFNNINTYLSGPPDEIAVVADSMSYAVKGAYFSPAYKEGLWDGRKSFYHSKYDYFPTGLLPTAVEALKKKGLEWKFVDARPDGPLEEYQDLNLTVELMDYQQEAVEAFLKHRRGIVQLATRAGKTLVAVACTQRLNVNTLFICPSIDLTKQTKREYEDRAGIEVGTISEGVFEPSKVTVGLIHSIDALLKSKNETLVKAVRLYLESVELVILDEVHRVSERYKRVAKLFKRARYRLGISATPTEGGKEKKLNAMSLTGGIIFHVKMDKLVKKKRIVKPVIYFVRCRIIDSGWSTWDEIYTNGVVLNEERNLLISLIVRRYWKKRRTNSLILTEKLEHGSILLGLLQKSMSCQFVSGKDEGHIRQIARWDLESGKLGALITSRIFNEGINLPSLELTVNASGYRSAIQVYQKFGRGITATETKTKTTVIDFLDSGNRLLEKHSNERLSLAQKEKAFEVHVVDYEDLGTEIWKI